jgi:hypothetical protein
MMKRALLAFLCVVVACSSDPQEDPQRGEASGAESTPSTPLPEDRTAPVSPPADGIAPADSNTTLPAATPEEAAPPPEP